MRINVASVFIFFISIFILVPFAYADVTKWDTGWGGTKGVTHYGTIMTVIDNNGQITGTFSHKDGRILGTYSDGIFDGIWTQSSSDIKCGSKKAGSFFWGKVRFNVAPSETRFSGHWGYCESKPTRIWKGKLIK